MCSYVFSHQDKRNHNKQIPNIQSITRTIGFNSSKDFSTKKGKKGIILLGILTKQNGQKTSLKKSL